MTDAGEIIKSGGADAASATESPWLSADAVERIAKLIALLAVACYGSGYLIVVTNDGKNGFFETDIFKPRAIVAGAEFFFYLACTLFFARINFFRKDSEEENTIEHLSRIFLGVTACVAAVAIPGVLMMAAFQHLSQGASLSYRGIYISMLVPLIVLTCCGLIRNLSVRLRPVISLVFSGLGILALAIAFFHIHRLVAFRCIIWTFCIAIFAKIWGSDIRRTFKSGIDFFKIVWPVVSMIGLYSLILFPYMTASFGGGAPIDVTVHLSKDSPMHPNQTLRAGLLESSTSGYYLTFDGEASVIYLPKESVTAIEYYPPVLWPVKFR